MNFSKIKSYMELRNHEQMFINGKYGDHCSPLAKRVLVILLNFMIKYDVLLK